MGDARKRRLKRNREPSRTLGEKHKLDVWNDEEDISEPAKKKPNAVRVFLTVVST